MPSNYLAFHLLCHLYIYFTRVIGTRQIYNENSYSEIPIHTTYGKAINYTDLETNEEVSTVLFEQVAFNSSPSNEPGSQPDSNPEKHKVVLLSNPAPPNSANTSTNEYYSFSEFEENVKDSAMYEQEKFDFGSQNDLKGSLTTSFILLIFQKPSKNSRVVRSNPEYNTNSSNLLAATPRIKSENRIISFDDVVHTDTTGLPQLDPDSQSENATFDVLWEISTQLNDSADWNITECAPTFNCTDVKHAPTFRTRTLIKCVVLLSLGSAAVFGNVATLSSIIRRGRQKTSTVYLLLMHLSIADLMVTWFCIIGEGVWMLAVQWYAGNAFCKFFKFLQMLALYLSTFILVVIGIDRLCAVRFPMRRIKARMQIQKYIFGAWVLSCGLSAPQRTRCRGHSRRRRSNERIPPIFPPTCFMTAPWPTEC